MRARRADGIDAQLIAYASSTRTTLAGHDRRSAGLQWVVYGAAAGAALVMAPAAEALPIYSGLQDIRLSASETAPLDLDGDAAIDFTLRRTGLAPSPGNRVVGSEIGVQEGWRADYLILGDPVSGLFVPRFPVRYFVELNPVYTSNGVVVAGTWPLSVTGFAGVRFKHSGEDFFGWIRLHIEADNGQPIRSLVIKDWAYESEPGVEIQAGDGLTPVPEPGGLALLATGAAGIAAWRRRANQRRHTS